MYWVQIDGEIFIFIGIDGLKWRQFYWKRHSIRDIAPTREAARYQLARMENVAQLNGVYVSTSTSQAAKTAALISSHQIEIQVMDFEKKLRVLWTRIAEVRFTVI